MTEVKMTKIEKAIDLLVNQRLKLTEGQLASRLGTTGVGARSLVNKVRGSGYTIYTNAGGFDKQGLRSKVVPPNFRHTGVAIRCSANCLPMITYC